jgi:hypothetical protein
MRTSITLCLSLALLTGPLACAKDDDPSESAPLDTGVEGGGSVDATADGKSDVGIDGGGTDAGLDAAREGGTDATPSDVAADDTGDDAGTGSYFRVANLRSETFVVCYRLTGTTAYTGPLYEAEGGLATDQVSDWIPIENRNYDVIYVLPGAGCSGTYVFSSSITLAASVGSARLSLFVRPTSSGGFLSGGAVTAGKDTVYYRPDSRNASFVPDADPTAAVPLTFITPTLLDGEVVGKIVLTFSGASRPFKTKAGGKATVFGHDEKLIVCDDLAPPIGHLSDCSAGVRLP